MITIRPETRTEVDAVRRLNRSAFDGPVEAAIVDALRAHCDDLLSLVALDPEDEDAVVGHILFSPVTIDPEDPDDREPRGAGTGGMGLAPMAVLPGRQRRGIGTALVHRGLADLRERGCPFVVVLGHPGYYPRFGFRPASRFGLRSQWDGVADEAFMALELRSGALDGVRGAVRYRPEFEAAATDD
jgi:putative acetyltransferase